MRALSVLLLLVLWAPRATAYAVLDQKHVVQGSREILAGVGAAEFAQTFTAGVSGRLTSVGLSLARTATEMDSNLIFSIHEVNASASTLSFEQDLLELVVPRASSPLDDWSAGTSIDLSGRAVNLEAGRTYAIRLFAELLYPANDISFYWAGDLASRSREADPYSRGEGYVRSQADWGTGTFGDWQAVGIDDGGALSEYADFGFSTTVTVVPIPGAVWLFGSGLALLALIRGRLLRS